MIEKNNWAIKCMVLLIAVLSCLFVLASCATMEKILPYSADTTLMAAIGSKGGQVARVTCDVDGGTEIDAQAAVAQLEMYHITLHSGGWGTGKTKEYSFYADDGRLLFSIIASTSTPPVCRLLIDDVDNTYKVNLPEGQSEMFEGVPTAQKES